MVMTYVMTIIYLVYYMLGHIFTIWPFLPRLFFDTAVYILCYRKPAIIHTSTHTNTNIICKSVVHVHTYVSDEREARVCALCR